MFLGKLNKEIQELFLELCIHASLSNEVITQEEKDIIDAYCLEMGLPQSDYKISKNIDCVLSELKLKCTTHELNIVFIEITALIMSDNAYDSMEQIFMKSLQNSFGFTDDKLKMTINAVHELMQAYNLLNNIMEQ